MITWAEIRAGFLVGSLPFVIVMLWFIFELRKLRRLMNNALTMIQVFQALYDAKGKDK